MQPKPEHFGIYYAEAFKDHQVVDAYRYRPPYPTAPVPFSQSIDDFIEGLHSRSGFSRERMGRQKATDFDQQGRTLLLQFHKDGVLPLQVVGTVTWGTLDAN